VRERSGRGAGGEQEGLEEARGERGTPVFMFYSVTYDISTFLLLPHLLHPPLFSFIFLIRLIRLQQLVRLQQQEAEENQAWADPMNPIHAGSPAMAGGGRLVRKKGRGQRKHHAQKQQQQQQQQQQQESRVGGVPGGDDYIGRMVEIVWVHPTKGHQWCPGVVKAYRPDTDLHLVVYDDGDQAWYNLVQVRGF
jgi:hypothetical protein